MNKVVVATFCFAFVCAPSHAKKLKDAWAVSRMTDPITGKSSCVVAVYDQAASSSFSRVGYLYPIVENNETLGLLVGVSTGGRYRLPAGDIMWRVDDKPYRLLRAFDNPATRAASLPAYKSGNEAMDNTVAAAMAMANVSGAMSPSTVATGDRAMEMLSEMLSGHGLIFRSAAASTPYGLPNAQTNEVGRSTKDGLRPVPLDASLRAGLGACGIKIPAPTLP